MKAIADVCIVPLGVGLSLSEYVAACERIFKEAGLNPQLHAYGTNIEGDLDEVVTAIKRCHERMHEMGAPRITTSIRLGTRTDKLQTMQEKVDSVQRHLDEG